jgi:hypothetical protein
MKRHVRPVFVVFLVLAILFLAASHLYLASKNKIVIEDKDYYEKEVKKQNVLFHKQLDMVKTGDWEKTTVAAVELDEADTSIAEVNNKIFILVASEKGLEYAAIKDGTKIKLDSINKDFKENTYISFLKILRINNDDLLMLARSENSVITSFLISNGRCYTSSYPHKIPEPFYYLDIDVSEKDGKFLVLSSYSGRDIDFEDMYSTTIMHGSMNNNSLSFEKPIAELKVGGQVACTIDEKGIGHLFVSSTETFKANYVFYYTLDNDRLTLRKATEEYPEQMEIDLDKDGLPYLLVRSISENLVLYRCTGNDWTKTVLWDSLGDCPFFGCDLVIDDENLVHIVYGDVQTHGIIYILVDKDNVSYEYIDSDISWSSGLSIALNSQQAPIVSYYKWGSTDSSESIVYALKKNL